MASSTLWQLEANEGGGCRNDAEADSVDFKPPG